MWTIAAAEIEVTDSEGASVERRIAVRLVKDWTSSPFVRINPKRRALVGRDILRAFSLEVSLRAGPAVTEIERAR